HFFDGLSSNRGQCFIGRVHQTSKQLVLIEREDQLSGDRLAKVAICLFNQATGPKFFFVSEVGQVVFGFAPTRTCIRQQEPSVTELILGDVGQGNVFFHFWCTRNPVAQPLREHQGVVA